MVNLQEKNDRMIWCDKCFEKSSFTDFINGYPSIIIDHLVDKINQLEKENLKLKLLEKENEIQTLKNDNNNLISTIKLFENILKIEGNKINDFKAISIANIFDLKKGEFLMPVIFQSVDSKIH